MSKKLSKTERLSVDAMRRRRQQIAFDANMERVYHWGSPYTVRCLKEYNELTAAIDEMESERSEQLSLFALETRKD